MGSNIKLKPFNASTEAEVERCAYISWTPVSLTVEGRNSSDWPNVVRPTSKSLTSEGVQLQFKSGAVSPPQDSIEIGLGETEQAKCYSAGKF